MNKRYLSILSYEEISSEMNAARNKVCDGTGNKEIAFYDGVNAALKWVLSQGGQPCKNIKRLPGSQVYDKEAKELRWVSGSLVQRYQD